MALLTLCLPLGGLEGDQYRAHLWLGSSLYGRFSQDKVRATCDARGIKLGAKWLVVAYARLGAL